MCKKKRAKTYELTPGGGDDKLKYPNNDMDTYPNKSFSASNKIVKFLFRNNLHTCFFLHMDDDFLLSNTVPLSFMSVMPQQEKGGPKNINQVAQNADEEKSNNLIILKLLYIYYWSTVCGCGELENVGN
ncbi:hypothetical protein AK88_01321 [Plasmodium fragile]|uniref:Uncharacterized protein n=1 Tax=Plasmodium fragile TaxID=5857 RepID=A0A0D9QPN6_PLAFR|nr:uncharacterized protein AK88_01321 [Plasmodium fragile]KJP89029.1 hypothetical protein AK88_01321 [Plasmodium fragile]